MKEPTNQMLIDALVIVMAQQLRPADLDLDRDPAITKIIGTAQLIVINASPIAIARIMREAEQQRAESEPREYRLTGSDRVFYTANALEIDTRNPDTMAFMQDAMRQGAPLYVSGQGLAERMAMRVAELIKLLQAFHPDDEVRRADNENPFDEELCQLDEVIRTREPTNDGPGAPHMRYLRLS